jgi:hypothetical protein
MKISKKLDRKKVEIGDVTVWLKPFPYDEIRYERGASDPIDVEKTMFMSCVDSWEGLEDLDTGKAFECSEENKLHVFRYEYAFRQEIILNINEMMSRKLEQIKNLSRSQSGKETETNSSATTATKSTPKEESPHPVENATDPK